MQGFNGFQTFVGRNGMKDLEQNLQDGTWKKVCMREEKKRSEIAKFM